MKQMRLFQKLTPTAEVKLTIYEDAFNFVFQQPDVKNVAISGAYSSGKSSVLESYKTKHSDTKFLHVSLAHFASVTNDEDRDEADVEGKVLNQLIHLIPPENIPRTDFKVKRDLSRLGMLINTSMFMLFLVLIAYICFWKPWSSFISALDITWIQWLFLWTTSRVALFFAGMLGFGLLGTAVYALVRTGLNRISILKRVNIQGNGIELFEQAEDSYFDRHLNEVLYLFDKADADVIVFEDIDRFNNNNLIFEKLRQVNTLVNSPKARTHKPIRFFYLLRDDIFASKDRTKFFDFIMPVVPVLDGSNSYDKFIEYLTDGNIGDLFDESFLQRLSLYVDDMRLLKNIYNEFLIYYDRIQSIDLDPNRLLALIVYKNIFPHDFSDLQLRRGFIHTLFNNKPAIVRTERQRVLNEITGLERAVEQLNAEHLRDIEELDAVYFRSNEFLRVNNQVESQFPTRAAFITALRANPAQVQAQRAGGWHSKTLDGEFTKLEQDEEYRQRHDAITQKSTGEVQRLMSRIEKLRIEAEVISDRRLQDLITKENITGIFEDTVRDEVGEEIAFGEIKKSEYFDLIKFLVRNGYIDGSYPDYMTYFYENSLSRIDKIFLRSVTDQVPKEYTYALKNPEVVVSRLEPADFKRPEILNFELLRYLLNTKETNTVYLTHFLRQLINNRNYEFIAGYLASGATDGLFVVAMNNLWSGIFNGLLTASKFSRSQLINYAVDTLLYSAPGDIQAVNEDDCLSGFISRQPTFLNIECPNVQKLIESFLLINVRFSSIDYTVSNQQLFLAMYTNNLYEINFEQICLMLHVLYGLPRHEDFSHKNYSLVLSQPDQLLAQYVSDNMELYLDVVLANCDGRIIDEETAVLNILNNSDISDNQRDAYMQALQTKISDITAVNDEEVWGGLLEQDCVDYSTENILNYFFSNENGMDSVLVDFINRSNTELEFVYKAIDAKFGDDSGAKFYVAIIRCSELANPKYESLLRFFDRYYSKFTFKGLDTDKVSILIRLQTIRMNEHNLLFMRENYPDNVVEFIVHNISKYSESVINEDTYDFEELLMILDENVADKYKLRLLRLTDQEISVTHKNFSARVKQQILSNNFDLNDLPFLFRTYSNEGKLVRTEIDRLARKHVTVIIENEWLVPFDLLSEMLSDQELVKTTREALFATCLPSLSRNQALDCSRILQLDDLSSLFNGKHPTFALTTMNHKILSTFKSKGWITNLKQEGNRYRAYGRKTGTFRG